MPLPFFFPPGTDSPLIILHNGRDRGISLFSGGSWCDFFAIAVCCKYRAWLQSYCLAEGIGLWLGGLVGLLGLVGLSHSIFLLALFSPARRPQYRRPFLHVIAFLGHLARGVVQHDWLGTLAISCPNAVWRDLQAAACPASDLDRDSRPLRQSSQPATIIATSAEPLLVALCCPAALPYPGRPFV